jgi:hypothetical protein
MDAYFSLGEQVKQDERIALLASVVSKPTIEQPSNSA